MTPRHRHATARALAGCLAALLATLPGTLSGSMAAAASPPPHNPKLEITRAAADTRVPVFTAVLVEPVVVEFRAVEPMSGPTSLNTSRTEFPPTDRDRERVARDFDEVMREELSRGKHPWTLATARGPGVLVVQPALRDIVWRLPPEEPAGSKIYLDTVADLTLVVDFIDGATGQPVGRAEDRRTAEPAAANGSFGALRGNRVAAHSEVRRTDRRWASRLAKRLDQLYYEAKPR